MSVACVPAVVPRLRDFKHSAVHTTPAGPDRHTHCAIFDPDGNGHTSPGPDGHVHRVIELEVQAERGHAHDLSARRCDAKHNDRGNHVVPRPRT